MPAEEKSLEKSVDDGGTDEHEGVPTLITAIRKEMDNMTLPELERLHAAVALMEQKKRVKNKT